MKTTGRLVATALVLAAVSISAPAQVGEYPYCQIVDRYDEPIWHAEAGLILTEDVKREEAGDFGIMQLMAGTGIAYLPTEAGTLDLRVELEAWRFTDDGGIDLPDQVGSLYLDALWTHRLPNGLALRAGIQPGLFTDMEDISGNDFFIPIKLNVIQSFNDQLSGLAGFRIYPGFDRVVDPDLGFRWVLWETWKFDLFYPESRIVLAPTDLWRAYVGFRTRRWTEFKLERRDPRGSLLYDEDRLFAGFSLAMFTSAQLVVEAGQTLNREVDFENGGVGGDLKDAPYVSVGLTGLL